MKKLGAYAGIIAILATDVAWAFVPLMAQQEVIPDASVCVYQKDLRTVDVEYIDAGGEILESKSIFSEVEKGELRFDPEEAIEAESAENPELSESFLAHNRLRERRFLRDLVVCVLTNLVR